MITGARIGGAEKESAGNEPAENAGASNADASNADARKAGAEGASEVIEHAASGKAKLLSARLPSLPIGNCFPQTSGNNRHRVRDLRVTRIKKWEHRVAIMVASMCRIAPIGREARYPQHTWFLCRYFPAPCNSAPARLVAPRLWRGGWSISGRDMGTMLRSWFDRTAQPKARYSGLMIADNK